MNIVGKRVVNKNGVTGTIAAPPIGCGESDWHGVYLLVLLDSGVFDEWPIEGAKPRLIQETHIHQHGPCATDGAPVRDQLGGLPDWLRVALFDRLNEGERKCDAQLVVGWPDAKLAGFQAALDGLAYAIADDDHEGVALWVSMCIRLRSRMGGGAL